MLLDSWPQALYPLSQLNNAPQPSKAQLMTASGWWTVMPAPHCQAGAAQCHLPARVGIKADHIIKYSNQHSGEGKGDRDAHQGSGQAVCPAGIVVPGMLQAVRVGESGLGWVQRCGGQAAMWVSEIYVWGLRTD